MIEIWMNAPWIDTYENYEENESPININDIAWFDVKIALLESDNEKKENLEAMKQQMELGILQRNGLPAGMQIPQSTIQAFNSRNKITPIFKMPQGQNRQFVPTRAPVPVPADIFQKANKKMNMLDELTRDRRKI